MTAVGIEPTPPKRLRPEHSALTARPNSPVVDTKQFDKLYSNKTKSQDPAQDTWSRTKVADGSFLTRTAALEVFPPRLSRFLRLLKDVNEHLYFILVSFCVNF
jgi:hypothetical protein